MNVKSTNLSVVVITLNEQEYLGQCLESIKTIADEIVVVDSGSTDKTLEIAKKYNARIYYREFDNYANQKNYAANLATGGWVLSLDGDETLENNSGSEIMQVIQDNNKLSAYTMPRKNIIFGKEIKYSRWQPELDRHIWLWKKNMGKWIGDVHEEVVVKSNVGKLKYGKIHNQYKNIREFLDMMNKYSNLEAKQYFEKGIKFSLTKLFLQPIYNFLVRYFYRLGFLDGWRGFVLSYLMALYHFILWIKIWHLQEVKISNS